MARKKKKSRPKEKPKAETKPRDMPKNNILQSLSSDGWVQNITASVLVFGTAIVCIVMKTSTLKTTVFTACVLLTTLIWIVGFRIVSAYDQPDDKGIVFAVDNAITENDDFPPFWIRYRSSIGDTRSPMPVAMYVAVTNTRNIPVTLDSIGLRAWINNGKWVKFRHVNTLAGTVYWMYGGALNDAGELNLSGNGLDQQLDNKAIPAHATIRGWVFFDPEKPFRVVDGDLVTYEWRALDSVGEEYTTISKPEPIQRNPAPSMDANLTGSKLVFKGAHIDLSNSGIKEKRWNESIISAPTPSKAN